MPRVTLHFVSLRQDCITHEAKSYKKKNREVKTRSVSMMLVSYAECIQCLQFNWS